MGVLAYDTIFAYLNFRNCPKRKLEKSIPCTVSRGSVREDDANDVREEKTQPVENATRDRLVGRAEPNYRRRKKMRQIVSLTTKIIRVG